jgi:phospholipid/cholesterol/gamma-HCH transport system substrate-binding protein
VADANRVTHRINAVLGDENLAAIRAALANIKSATEPLPAASRDALALVKELRGAIAEAKEVAANANHLVGEVAPPLTASAARLQETADRLASLSGRIDALVARHQADFDEFAGPGLHELQGLLRESRDAAAEVRELAHGLRDEPSRLLYERPAAGVEIPR